MEMVWRSGGVDGEVRVVLGRRPISAEADPKGRRGGLGGSHHDRGFPERMNAVGGEGRD
jgi:hypothetical protein